MTLFNALIITHDGASSYEYRYNSEVDLYFHLHETSERHEFHQPEPHEHYDDIIVVVE